MIIIPGMDTVSVLGGCRICGKKPVAGRRYSRRGMLKKKGGVGRRTTRKNIRVFSPNLQRVRVIIKGTVQHLRVCTACLRSGRVAKAPPRKAIYTPA